MSPERLVNDPVLLLLVAALAPVVGAENVRRGLLVGTLPHDDGGIWETAIRIGINEEIYLETYVDAFIFYGHQIIAFCLA